MAKYSGAKQLLLSAEGCKGKLLTADGAPSSDLRVWLLASAYYVCVLQLICLEAGNSWLKSFST